MISSAHKTDILYHTGQRTLKMTGDASTVDLNAQLQQIVSGLNRVTIYPSPYLVLTEQGYTKHYYAGADRVCARLGSGGLDHDTACISRNEEVSTRVENLFWHGLKLMDAKEFKPEIIKDLQLVDIHGKELDWLKNVDIEKLLMRLRISVKPDPWSIHKIIDDLVRERPDDEPEVYFYHSDHLGGASWITDGDGVPVQHLQYLPFGEPFVDQHPAGYQERYTFTGKERDEETGYGYFGARYMDHEMTTMWLSVDPLADKYPNISPYNYCMWNPIKLVDPNGLDTIRINLDEGAFEQIKADGDHRILYYKDGKVVDCLPSINKEKCSFLVSKPKKLPYIENGEEKDATTNHLYCTNSETGELIFKKIAELGSPVEWDYYSIKSGNEDLSWGDLSSSGLKDKMIHGLGQYTKRNVNYWDHYHPNNHYDSYYPSHEDQDRARELIGIKCTIFNSGRSMIFGNYVPPEKGAYIDVHKFMQLWNQFAR